MALAQSKLTAQGQVSVPAEVLERDDDGDRIVVRGVGRYSSEDGHRALFPTPPHPKTLADLKGGMRHHIKRRRAGRDPNVLVRLTACDDLTVRAADAVAAATEHFRKRPALGFSNCLVLEVARKAGHLPLDAFDRTLARLDDVERL